LVSITLGSYSLKAEFKKFQMKEEECQLRQCMTKDEICKFINDKFLNDHSTSSSSPATTSNSSPVSSATTSNSSSGPSASSNLPATNSNSISVDSTPVRHNCLNNSGAPTKQAHKSKITIDGVRSFKIPQKKILSPSPIRGKDQELQVEYDDIDDAFDFLDSSQLNWRQHDFNITVPKSPKKNFEIFSKENRW